MALAPLQPHNEPSDNETLPSRRLRNRHTKRLVHLLAYVKCILFFYVKMCYETDISSIFGYKIPFISL